MKIYTKSGDTGETSLIGGKRVSKSAEIFNVLGTLDELNASLGFLQLVRIKEVKELTVQIQSDLFQLGALLSKKEITQNEMAGLFSKTTFYEGIMDNLDKELPELKNFILPGGSLYSSYLHTSRAICRRAERSLVDYLNKNNYGGMEGVLSYLNRLSDLLFVLARYTNSKLGVRDQIWNSN